MRNDASINEHDYLSNATRHNIAPSLNDHDNDDASVHEYRHRDNRNHASFVSDSVNRVLLTERTSRLCAERGLTSSRGNRMQYPRRRTSWVARRHNPVPHRPPVGVPDGATLVPTRARSRAMHSRRRATRTASSIDD